MEPLLDKNRDAGGFTGRNREDEWGAVWAYLQDSNLGANAEEPTYDLGGF